MKKIGIILTAIGFLIIIYALVSKFSVEKKSDIKVSEYENYINWINENQISQEDMDLVDKQQSVVPEEEIEIPDGLLGIMEIDKIDLSVTIAEGTDNKSITLSVGHFPQTAMAGEKGNFAVVGHRSYRYGAYFNRLDEVEAGDIIRVKTVDGQFEYEVDEIFVVEPEEVWVLDSTDEATITLVTCTPIRTATHRLIVKGHLV